MKKIILLLAVALAFGSCKKCYDCTTEITTTYREVDGKPIYYTYFQNGYSATSTKTTTEKGDPFESCDKDDVKYYQEPKTSKYIAPYPGSNGVEVTITSLASCIEK